MSDTIALREALEKAGMALENASAAICAYDDHDPSIAAECNLAYRAICVALASPALGGDGWRNISSAPNNHLPVLTWSEEIGRVVAFRDVAWAWWPLPASYPLSHPPTHWRPLPERPTPGEEK